MKNSRRLLLGTFLTLLAVPVVVTAYSRVAGSLALEGAQAPERIPAAELAALRDFSAIDIRGDVAVEIVQANGYAIEYTPLSETRGNFTARVDEGVLVIEAFGNRAETGTATLRIGMPELQRLDASFLHALTIREFDSTALTLAINVMPGGLLLQNNRIDALTLDLQRVDTVTLRANTFGTTELRHFGSTIITD